MKRVTVFFCLLLLLCGCSGECKHKNTQIVNAKEPSCVQTGYSGDTICTDCNAVLTQGTEVPVLDHDWEYEGCIEATCTTPGNSGIRKCKRCGSVTGTAAEIAPLGHIGALQNVVQVTCKDPGYSGDEVCIYCGLLLTPGEVIPAGTHAPEVRGAVEPTCTADGYSGDTYCSACDLLMETGHVLPKGHTSVTKNAKAATCRQDGYSGDTYCSVCGAALTTGKVLPKSDHTPAPATDTPATCTTDGQTAARICSVCGTEISPAAVIPATGHKNTEVRGVIDAQVGAEGYSGDTYCADCGELLSAGSAVDALPAPTNASEVSVVSGDSGWEATIFRQVNEARAENGLSALTWNSSLYNAAAVRAQEHIQNYRSGMTRDAHTRPDGTAFSTALIEAGISFAYCGENLAVASTPSAITQAWLNSPGHRGNIMDTDFTSAVMYVIYSGGLYYAVNLFLS